MLGGGSNLVVSDQGFDGHVLQLKWRGKKRTTGDSGEVFLTVQAGEDWDDLVAYCVEQGLRGLESLSGIPGTVGASVIQNIGAYGYEVSEVLDHIDFLDYQTGEERTLYVSDLGLGHRTSHIKTGELQGMVLSVTFRLEQNPQSLPIAYQQVADALEVSLGDSMDLSVLRDTVLELRRSKGMLIDPDDPDSRSVGSFFVNPVVSEQFSYSLPPDMPRWRLGEVEDTVVALAEAHDEKPHESAPDASRDGLVKLSAAWLIEHSGIPRGFQLPGNPARVSTKHTLAITNPGEATSEDLSALARYIRTQVANTYGVVLQPEPTLIGITLV